MHQMSGPNHDSSSPAIKELGISFDHLAIPCLNAELSARELAMILELPIGRDGPDDEFYCLWLDRGVQLLFTEGSGFDPLHCAFRVRPAIFDLIIERLTMKQYAFGNDPEDPVNGEFSDPLGGLGRAYFTSRDGHLFEICC